MAASIGGYAFVGVRYGLGVWGWVGTALVLALMAGYAVAAGLLLRQPGVALPGMLGAVLIVVAWLAPGYSRYASSSW